jgi:hypothetical protein
MDDIKIVCPDEFTARKALKHLILELRGHGLAVNAKKTSLSPATVISDNQISRSTTN